MRVAWYYGEVSAEEDGSKAEGWKGAVAAWGTGESGELLTPPGRKNG